MTKEEILKQVQDDREKSNTRFFVTHFVRSSRMTPSCHPKMSPAPVALKRINSGSLNRGNTFPSKLLFLSVTLKCLYSGSRFLFLYQGLFRKQKNTRLWNKFRTTKKIRNTRFFVTHFVRSSRMTLFCVALKSSPLLSPWKVLIQGLQIEGTHFPRNTYSLFCHPERILRRVSFLQSFRNVFIRNLSS